MIQIDFYEIAFLLESCIPPAPIARMSVWHKAIDAWWHKLSWSDRERLFEWIKGKSQFTLFNEDCQLFYARYNPENQYEVIAWQGDTKVNLGVTFLRDGMYWVTRRRCVSPDVIAEVKKVVPDELGSQNNADTCILIGCDGDTDDYFTSGPVTSCCQVGPITNENFCPNCGAMICEPKG